MVERRIEKNDVVPDGVAAVSKRLRLSVMRISGPFLRAVILIAVGSGFGFQALAQETEDAPDTVMATFVSYSGTEVITESGMLANGARKGCWSIEIESETDPAMIRACYWNGVLDGEYLVATDFGLKVTAGRYVAGEKNGIWYELGEVWLHVGAYSNGVKTGVWRTYEITGEWAEVEHEFFSLEYPESAFTLVESRDYSAPD